MASTVTVTIKYEDGSKSFSESFVCADTHPHPDILKELEKQQLQKWEGMGNAWRGIKIDIKVKP